MKPKFAQGYLDSYGKLHATYEAAEEANKYTAVSNWWDIYCSHRGIPQYITYLDALAIREKVNQIMGTGEQT